MTSQVSHWRSLKFRVTLLTLAIFLASIWSLALYVSRMLRDDLVQVMGEAQFSTVSFVAANLNHALSDRLNALEKIAKSITPAMMNHPQALQKFLEEQPVFADLFNGGIFVTGMDGTAFADVPRSSGRIGVNYIDRESIAVPLKEGKPVFGRPVIGKKLLAPLFSIVVPIRDAHGKVSGAMAGTINLGLPNFLDQFTQSRYGKTGGYLLVAPKHGLVVTATDKRRVMAALAGPGPAVQGSTSRFIEGYEGYDVVVNSLGMQVLASAKSVPIAGWYVAASLPTAEAFTPIQDMQRRILLVTVLLTLLSGGLTWGLLRRQLLPLRNAAKTLKSMTDRQLPLQALPIVVKDEVGELIAGFNQLLEVVEVRTKELAQAQANTFMLVKHAPISIAMFDTQMNYLATSDSWLAEHGAGQADLVGRHHYEVIPDIPDTWKQVHQQCLAGQTIKNEEDLWCRADGSQQWMLWAVVPWKRPDGAIGGIIISTEDITQRKNAQAQVDKLLHEQKVLLDSAIVGIFKIQNRTVLWVNRAFEHMLGYGPSECVGLSTRQFFASQADDRTLGAKVSLALRKEGAFRGECKFLRKDGSPVWADMSLTLLSKEDGISIGALLDVTERVAADAALHDSEARLNRVLEGSDQAFWDWNLFTNDFKVSPRFETMLGYAPGELDVSVSKWPGYVQESDLARANISIERHLSGKSMSHEVEVRCRSKSGEWRWVLTRGRIVKWDDQGQPFIMSGTFADINDRKWAEQALHDSELSLTLALDGGDMAMWDWRIPSGELYFNARWAAIQGEALEDLPQRVESWEAHICPDDMAQVRKNLDDHFRGKTPSYESEHRVRHKEGHWVWVQGRGKVVDWDASGNPVRALGTAIDITGRMQEKESLRQAKAGAESANNAKSRFLAAASHDLRQPLAALSLYTGILKNTPLASDQELVANMQVCIEGLSELLNDLLDLSKLDAGVVTPIVKAFAVADLFDSLASVHAPKALVKGLRLRFVACPWTCSTDLVLFRRVLGNLIHNALRYTERGGVLVACRRRLGKTWVEVWDSGIGILPEQMQAIFEEFKQLGDGARNKGSGLGLTIVAKTAAVLGLEISVRSRIGRGSVFAIELPLGSQAVAQSTVAEAALAHAIDKRSLRIALVEDSEIVREALVEVLHRLGHEVLATDTGAALLAELDLFEPDIVVSDYRLTKGESGLEVITAVRARFGPEFPALLITGDTDTKLLRSMNDRSIFVMHKSLNLDDLRATLEKLTSHMG